MNYYEVLGVDIDATKDEIKQAYRKMAKRHHPDVGGDPTFFQKGQKAYKVLIDSELREQYDAVHSFRGKTKRSKTYVWKDITKPSSAAGEYQNGNQQKGKKTKQWLDLGNVSANIVNGGFAATDGNWVFYSGKNGLYRMKEDGSSLDKLMDGEVKNINVNGKSVFCSNDEGIFKINYSGMMGRSGEESTTRGLAVKIIDRKVSNLVLQGERLYFLIPDQWGIFSTNLDGRESTFVIYDDVRSMMVKKEWIYYIKGSFNEKKLYKVRVDGTCNEMVLAEERMDCFVIDGDIIYFSREEGFSGREGRLYKATLNNHAEEIVKEVLPFSPYKMYVEGEELIYFNRGGKRGVGGNSGLYLSGVNGEGRVKIGQPYKGEFRGVNVVGEWIYYHDLYGLYRVHRKTFEKQKVD